MKEFERTLISEIEQFIGEWSSKAWQCILASDQFYPHDYGELEPIKKEFENAFKDMEKYKEKAKRATATLEELKK